MKLSFGLGLRSIYVASSGSGTPVNTIAPSIAITTGGGYAGSTYTATAGTWSSGTPTGQWTSNGSPISGETASTYVMDIALEGTEISYTETNGGVTADSNTIEMWVPADATGTLAAVMDIRQGITLASSSVTDWASQVGGISASQATGANQPTYSATGFDSDAKGISFDGSDDYLTGLAMDLSGANFSIISALTGTSTTEYYLISANDYRGVSIRFKSGKLDFIVPAVVDVGSSNTVLTNGTAYISSAKVSASAFAFFLGGVSDGSGTPAGTFGHALAVSLDIGRRWGASNYYPKPLSSMLMYTSYLSDTDLRKAEGWVAWTIGKQSLLDAGHTYKSAGPTI